MCLRDEFISLFRLNFKATMKVILAQPPNDLFLLSNCNDDFNIMQTAYTS